MPSKPMSSMRPTKGEMKVAPALAASSAWLAEKHSVTLTMRFISVRIVLQAFRPSSVSGTLMQILSAILARHLGFLHHLLVFGGDDFGRNRALDDAADFLGDLGDVAAGLQDQRRIGGDAVEQPEIVQLADFLHIGGIDKKFHDGFFHFAIDVRVALTSAASLGTSSACVSFAGGPEEGPGISTGQTWHGARNSGYSFPASQRTMFAISLP